MSLDKIQQLVGSLAKSMEEKERLATPVLAAKLAKCSAAYPHDQTLGSMTRVMEKMASNNTTFITRAELKSLYNKLYSRNTKFADLFSDELGLKTTEEVSPDLSGRDDSTEVNSYQVGDPVLANALNSVFDKNLPVKMYSQALADKAVRSVGSTLDSWNLRPSTLTVVEGSDKFLVIKADYETPKGRTSIFVPVETPNNKIVNASVFMGNSGPQELNHSTIKSYLTQYAGQKLKITAGSILGVLVKSTSENREVTAAEMALTRLHAKREGISDFFQGSIVGQKMAEASVKDVELPQSDEFVSFEKNFSSPLGVASFNFGADKVKTAREHIVRELNGFGLPNSQISVTGSNDNTIFYAVSLDAGKVAFTVPVKIADGKLTKPGILLCNGSVSSFDRKGINQLYVSNQTDFKVAAAASPSFGLKPSDLINNIREAMSDGNHAKAEDSLNVLASAGDDKAYAVGFQAYMQGLNKTASVQEPEITCSRLIKNATSEHPICSHTGLPAHKVYQDKDGNCRPLYRRGMDESYEGATFINSKIFG